MIKRPCLPVNISHLKGETCVGEMEKFSYKYIHPVEIKHIQESMLKMMFLLQAHYQIYRASRDQNLLHISQKVLIYTLTGSSSAHMLYKQLLRQK